ncbi:ndufa2, NADH:ubiquinone oxidoreductase 10.5kD subunit [Rhizophlyctis rosea]|uniref:Ndufa2, NADH:ubiquinone oxidoreductase 10.5kD subunit n=1 Tax=Rhizophlyctis rosea TaxID=64517 RepID=A0AAD5S763_9FUNG|nr:ndufa2, NADH:ubiquinone oxidoreductase 10.5kD subunit [Rhizophlyctis rosea]
MSSWRPLLSKNLKELRIHLCQKSPGSQGTREFILNQYTPIKQDNPTLPILVREASGVQARAFGRYGKEYHTALVFHMQEPIAKHNRCHRSDLSELLTHQLKIPTAFGKERQVPLENLSAAEVEAQIKRLAESA